MDKSKTKKQISAEISNVIASLQIMNVNINAKEIQFAISELEKAKCVLQQNNNDEGQVERSQ